MLNGLHPLILINLEKNIFGLSDLQTSSVPLISDVATKIPLPSIPIYLGEDITGIFITSESRFIDVISDVEQTKTNSTLGGSTTEVIQKPLNNTLKVSMQASTDSIGVSVFLAIMNYLFTKLTSGDYSITYIHGAMIIFGAKLDDFSVSQNNNNSLYDMSLTLCCASGGKTKIAAIPEVKEAFEAVPLPTTSGIA